MAIARELIESRSNRLTEEGKVVGTTVWQADTTPDQINAVTGLPPIGAPFPGFPAARAYDRQVEYERGSGTSDGAGGVTPTIRITIQYSSDPPTWGGVNPADPYFKSWTISYTTVDQPIPYAIRHAGFGRYIDAGGQQVSVDAYPILSTSFKESRHRYIRRVRVQNMSPDQWGAVAANQDKLNYIYGRWYVFNAGDIIEQARNTWDVQYTWMYDPGTFDRYSLGQPSPDMRWPSNLTVSYIPLMPGTWMRPPYHEVATITQVTGSPPAVTWPLFIGLCNYEVNINGHLSLPGFTL